MKFDEGSGPPLREEDLVEVFAAAEKPEDAFRIGAEGEKFGVHSESGKPLGYGEPFGVCKVLAHLEAEHGWSPVREVADGPVIALVRGSASVTLEPGAQLELSGEPLSDLHGIWDETLGHYREIAPVSAALGVSWLLTGFHPLAKLEELPWVPKKRYPIMRRYLPERGARGLDMMQRTSTVQANFDWSSERDGMEKLRLALRVAPIIHALFANSPFKEGKVGPRLSERGDVWLHMDPARSGLVESVFDAAEPRYEDYANWALDAGMFLVRRGDAVIENTGQTFRSFLRDGFEGHRATLADWKLHLGTLFPEVRLKTTLEVRPNDALPPALALGLIAVWTGLLYDERARLDAEALVESFDYASLSAARRLLVTEGLEAPIPGPRTGWELAELLVDAAQGGLTRRARLRDGKDETRFLGPVFELLARRRTPAHDALTRAAELGSFVKATAVDLSLDV